MAELPDAACSNATAGALAIASRLARRSSASSHNTGSISLRKALSRTFTVEEADARLSVQLRGGFK
jgi:hypothetical protein